jgi:hypothetical protein
LKGQLLVQRIGWDCGLDVTADGKGLVGHAGVVLLRRLADRIGLTGELAKALPASSSSDWLDRSVVLVQLVIAIALGAKNLSNAERLALHHGPLDLSGGSDSTMRRLLAELDAKAAISTVSPTLRPTRCDCASVPSPSVTHEGAPSVSRRTGPGQTPSSCAGGGSVLSRRSLLYTGPYPSTRR